MTANAAPTNSGPATGETLPVIPRHVGIIMDGNGRWAQRHGMPRSLGHERGVAALRRTVEASQKFGLEYLTVYSFSTENWRRPVKEVSTLFSLLKTFINQDLKRLDREGVKISVFGTRAGLPDDILALLDHAVETTWNNTGFNLGIAFNYGGREEIARVARMIAESYAAEEITAGEINEDMISQRLDTAGYPDPDLVIRTGEERRLSNFLIWQAAYAELVFLDVLWPEFGEQDLAEALRTFASRERRFGGLKSGAA